MTQEEGLPFEASPNKCDCCGRPPMRQIFVCSSSVGAASFGFCEECIQRVAEPEFCFHYLYDFVSTDGEGLSADINGLSTYKDGAYMSWKEWVAWRQHPDNKERLDKLRDEQLTTMGQM